MYALEFRNITKVYHRDSHGIVANDDVSLGVTKGTIHGLVGENGAGKTTLMRIAYGMIQPDKGSILVDGQQVRFASPSDAKAKGIGMVHQHFMLVPSMTVWENILLGVESRPKPVRFREAAERIRQISLEHGLDVDPMWRISELPVGVKQRIEVLKALYHGAEILILDEPTAVLAPREIKGLFTILRTLVGKGKTVILITHKLPEVMAITDRVTVMRRGKVVDTLETGETSETVLAHMMVGRDVVLQVQKPPTNVGDVVLKVEGVHVRDDRGLPVVNGVSFEVRAGEIFAIAGVEGNGQTELVEAIAGLRRVDAGRITLLGKDITHAPVRARREAGMSHIPEDRNKRGIDARVSVEDNIILGRHNRKPLAKGPFLVPRAIAQYASALIDSYMVVAPSKASAASALSGGNMQKLIVARELEFRPKLLLASQPTRGVDIASIEFIHQRLIEMARHGVAILLVSADLTEATGLCDRVGVMLQGQLVGVLRRGDVSEEILGELMTGSVGRAEGEAGII